MHIRLQINTGVKCQATCFM